TEIELATFKRAKLFTARHIEEVNRNSGKQLTERSESPRQQIVKEIADVPDIERTNLAAVHSPDGLDRFGCESKKAFGIGEKGAALLCQRNLLLCPIEKPDTELFFQIINLPRE